MPGSKSTQITPVPLGRSADIDPFPNDGTDAGPFYYANTDPGGIVNLVFDDHPSDTVSTIPFNRTVQFETYLSTFNNTTKVATIYDGYSWGYTVAAIPEPGSLACLLVSALTICIRRRPPNSPTQT